MQNFLTLAQIDETAQAIKNRISIQPMAGIILGSGLNNLADSVQSAVYIPFGELPNFPVSTVQGHSGRFVVGELEGKPVLVMQGRIHCYEGYSMSQTTLPVRVMQRLGIPNLMLTNAAGGINSAFSAGDAMLITDQINLVGMVGLNPLIGQNFDEIGTRFPDMSQVYDRAYCDLARQVAKENGIKLQEGVYIGLSGPAFESPAELRFLKMIGADAVGMSTVAEALVARHGNMRVLGISGISNVANMNGNAAPATHEEVMDAGKIITPKIEAIIRGVLRAL